jgi:hypothetical protein
MLRLPIKSLINLLNILSTQTCDELYFFVYHSIRSQDKDINFLSAILINTSDNENSEDEDLEDIKQIIFIIDMYALCLVSNYSLISYYDDFSFENGKINLGDYECHDYNIFLTDTNKTLNRQIGDYKNYLTYIELLFNKLSLLSKLVSILSDSLIKEYLDLEYLNGINKLRLKVIEELKIPYNYPSIKL